MLVCLWIQGSCCSWIPNSHCLRDAISSVSPAWSCDPSVWKPIIYEDWYIGECLIYEHWYIFDLYSNNIWRPRRLIYEDWYIFLIYIPIIYEDWYIGEINVCWRLLYAESAGDYCMFLLNLAGDYLCWRQIICVEIICVEIICVVCSLHSSPMKLIEPWATFYLPALKTAKGRWRLLLKKSLTNPNFCVVCWRPALEG